MDDTNMRLSMLQRLRYPKLVGTDSDDATPYAKVTYIYKGKEEVVEFPLDDNTNTILPESVKRFPTDFHWFLLGGLAGIIAGVILANL